MNKVKLKETSFLGVALAMSVSGLEVSANAVEMPKPGAGVTMNDFGQIEGFGNVIDSEAVVAQKSSSKKGCTKKGTTCGTSSGGNYGTSTTSGGTTKKGTKKGCSKKGTTCGTSSGGYTSTSSGGSTTSTSGGSTTTTSSSGGSTSTSGGSGTSTSGGSTSSSGGTPVPEPSMLGLFGLGAAAVVWGRRKRKSKSQPG